MARGLGAHASSVLINSIGVPQLYANVPGYREYEHAGSVRSQAGPLPALFHEDMQSVMGAARACPPYTAVVYVIRPVAGHEEANERIP